jgi:N-acetyl-anhydromuramyl-L-alanine amidase AmpD
MLTVRVRNIALIWSDWVIGARLYINPPGGPIPQPCNSNLVYATTDAFGKAELNVAGLLPGEHSLWIVPKETTTEPVGPRTATGPDVERIFRPLHIRFETGIERYVKRAWIHSNTLDNGTLDVNLWRIKAQELDVRLWPAWVKSPYHSDRGNQKIDMIVVHKTGDPTIGPAINTFLTGKTSAHYVVGRDGHVVKMVLDHLAAWHASHENKQDQSHWGTQTALAWRSIGIENVGTVKQGFTGPQYKSLIRLIQELMRTHNVPRHRVVAHSDILTDGHAHLSDDRIACPGYQFEWSQLENAQPPIGLARTGGNGGGDDPVAQFFQAMNGGTKPLILKPGDFDPQSAGGKLQPGKFGGLERKDITQTPIKQLQTWLAEIGYSVGPADGVFNRQTARAARHFQVHFEGRSDNDTINAGTAAMIRSVRAANPKAD